MPSIITPILLVSMGIVFGIQPTIATQTVKIASCANEEVCRYLAQEMIAVDVKCDRSERGNNKSKRICSIVHRQDEDENSDVSNPNSSLCKRTYKGSAYKYCKTYVKTHSPFNGYMNGEMHNLCYSMLAAYKCTPTNSDDNVAACEVVAQLCDDEK